MERISLGVFFLTAWSDILMRENNKSGGFGIATADTVSVNDIAAL